MSPEQERDYVRLIVGLLVAVGLLCGLCSALSGSWMIVESRRYAESFPPYPEGPPDAGVYGTLLGWLLLLSGVPLGLILLLIGGVLEYWRRKRPDQPPEDGRLSTG